MKSVKDRIELNNGYSIPCVGFGTYKAEGEEGIEVVREALRVGYRHIDTASFYGNEASVGEAVRMSGLDRSEVFITSKVWGKDQGYESTLRAFDRTMEQLKMDYLDLYLIHWPRVQGREDDWVRLNRETWQAMERLYEDGRIKAIGVSNFKTHHILSLMETSLTLPMVDQIELHPGLNQDETVAFCQANGIVVEAWSPFSRGAVFQSDGLYEIAEKHEKTPAQICLRWHLQKGIVPLPKSVTASRIAENADIFDFHLSENEMNHISAITDVKQTGWDPDEIAP